MKNIRNTSGLLAALSRRGYKARLVPVSILPALHRAFAARLKPADPVIQRYLSSLDYQPPRPSPTPARCWC